MSKSLEIEKVAHLTPLQEGMLFHTVMEPDSQAYFEQVRMTIRGELNLDALQRSFQTLVQRHETLRSNIYQKSASRSRLIIFKERTTAVHYENLTGMSETEQAGAIRSYIEADRNNYYDLNKDMLVRLAVLQTQVNGYTLLLSFHHIIMDGWCLGILMDELFAAYEALKDGKPVQLPAPQPYTGYSKWLEKQDKEVAKAYWRSALEGYDQPAGLTMLQAANPDLLEGGYRHREKKTSFSEEMTLQLRTIAERNGATLSSLFLAAWGIVLGRYNQSEDVVFGTVVSGRPPELEGVERIIGLFINTIPVRITLEAKQSFSGLLREIQRTTVQSRAYDYCSLAEVQALSELKQQLLDHIIVFENYPLEDMIGRPDLEERLGFIIEDAQLTEEIPYPFNIEVEDAKRMSFILSYNENVYKDEAMTRLAGHLENVLVQIAYSPEIPLQDIRLLSAEEETELTNVWSGVCAEFPDLTFHGIFEAQAELRPDQAAVLYEETTLTYRQLNERADRLAQTLQNLGAKRESLIAVMIDRSADMVTAVLGIMKAGAAYVPIDPTYPKDRIAYMLRDSGAAIVLTQSSLTGLLTDSGFGGEVVDLPALLLKSEGSLSTEHSLYTPLYDPEALAYVIYTSGTTGNAKGVMIEHRQYVNTSLGYKHAQGFNDFPVKLLQVASMSFDVFACDLAKVFVNGGTLVVCPQNVRNDPAALAKLLQEQAITSFEVPPVLLTLLMNYVYEQGTDLSAMKLVTTGADSFGVEDYRTILARFGDKMRILNTYGVTEAAIESSFYDGNKERLPASGIVPIGKALPNHKLYIVDESLRPVPVGVAGELCIGGASVGRGYLNRPELTAEKFVPSPFSEGERLYRTGDLARWLPEGHIDFIGRIDYQVKIRGYRIEPGEIESVLLKQEGVKQALVTDRSDQTGQKYLCAYVAGTADKSDLKAALERELPGYMVPPHIMTLEQLPLTHNGKIDRRALPEPRDFVLTGIEYEAPQTELEKTLASIWEETIGVKPIGLRNNFFELGGDSIKALQIAIRLNAKGLKLEVKDLFRYPQIDLIVPYIKKVTRVIPQGAVQGPLELTPIQRDFFENHRTERHHFNQAVMLRSTDRWNEDWLQSAMEKLVTHHDALRVTFDESKEGPLAYNRGVGEGEHFTLQSYDFVHSEQAEEDVRRIAEEFQSRFDLRSGPLVRLALFRLAEADHLLIIIHHLVVDGVSWRILLEDLGTAYRQAAGGEPLQLPAKTDSYKVWAAQLSLYGQSTQAKQEISYWSAVERRPVYRLPRDYEVSTNLVQDLRKSEVNLSAEETENLLKHVHHAYKTEINDLLLTALGLAFREWCGHSEIPVLLEGHGREELMKDIDISRTVGWFTTMYPFVLEVSSPGDLGYQIKLVKDKLRRMPNKGIGYGILRYLSGKDPSVSLVTAPSPEISFNYLGQFDEEAGGDMPWRTSDLSDYIGAETSLQAEKTLTFDINGMIMNGKLRLVFEYNGREYEASTVERLTAGYKKHLVQLIQHCCGKDTAEQSPTDFTYGQLSIAQLDTLSSSLSEKLLKQLK
ncbi:non-ribosomal peptide synthetase [Paenibacillus lutrae]|uniref:Amino acid adenylation domain-containing protein n=1 Tax=Paenibacillus lutrae TaxID=2078573 RepID=A0A7X3JXZ0_9BACL|nr:non-ribosomal peptide synthetase [Paenibacillus lutrae]MVO98370.1 amino acid adenylation domain-containing protein [Paenibacillus lutrae]